MQRGQQVPLCNIQCKSLSQSSRYATLVPKFSSVCSQAVCLSSTPPAASVTSRTQPRMSSLRAASSLFKVFEFDHERGALEITQKLGVRPTPA